MKRDRAAYMRDYRAAKQKVGQRLAATRPSAVVAGGSLDEAIQSVDLEIAHRHIVELEAEVRHLKAELAKRQGYGAGSDQASTSVTRQTVSLPATDRFNTQGFSPAPKNPARQSGVLPREATLPESRYTHDWTTAKLTPKDDEATKGALEALTEAGRLYDRYLLIAKLNVLPTPEELAGTAEEFAAPGDKPLGFVMIPSPMDIDLRQGR